MTALVAALLLLTPPPSDEAGLAVAHAADAADKGWVTESASAVMRIDQPNGRSEERAFQLIRAEPKPGEPGEKTLISITEPARHRGLRVLTLSLPTGQDDVYVHFPRHQRTKRIVGRKRTGRFLGSELTYEDLGSRKSHRYTHQFLREEERDGETWKVVATFPKDPDTGYGRVVLWRRPKTWEIGRVEYYGLDKTTLLKVGHFTEHKRMGAFSRPGRYTVENSQTGRKTTIEFTDRKLGLALDDEKLTPGGLTR